MISLPYGHLRRVRNGWIPQRVSYHAWMRGDLRALRVGSLWDIVIGNDSSWYECNAREKSVQRVWMVVSVDVTPLYGPSRTERSNSSASWFNLKKILSGYDDGVVQLELKSVGATCSKRWDLLSITTPLCCDMSVQLILSVAHTSNSVNLVMMFEVNEKTQNNIPGCLKHAVNEGGEFLLLCWMALLEQGEKAIHQE